MDKELCQLELNLLMFLEVYSEINLNSKIKQYSIKNKPYPEGRSTMGMPGTRAKKGIKKWKSKK